MTCALLHRILYQCASLLKSARVSVFFSFFRASVKRVLTVQYTNEILQREANVNTEKAYRIIFIFFLCWGEVRISFSFICFEHPFSPPLIRLSPQTRVEKKKKILLPLLAIARAVCVQSSLFSSRLLKQTNLTPAALIKHTQHTTQKPKPKVKRCLKNQSNRQRRRKRRPRTRTSTSTIRCVFLLFSFRSLSLARAGSLFNSKFALVFSFGTRLVRVFF